MVMMRQTLFFSSSSRLSSSAKAAQPSTLTHQACGCHPPPPASCTNHAGLSPIPPPGPAAALPAGSRTVPNPRLHGMLTLIHAVEQLIHVAVLIAVAVLLPDGAVLVAQHHQLAVSAPARGKVWDLHNDGAADKQRKGACTHVPPLRRAGSKVALGRAPALCCTAAGGGRQDCSHPAVWETGLCAEPDRAGQVFFYHSIATAPLRWNDPPQKHAAPGWKWDLFCTRPAEAETGRGLAPAGRDSRGAWIGPQS